MPEEVDCARAEGTAAGSRRVGSLSRLALLGDSILCYGTWQSTMAGKGKTCRGLQPGQTPNHPNFEAALAPRFFLPITSDFSSLY